MTAFSRYDVYTTVQSVYCYAGTDVLKNRLGIHDGALLRTAEEELTAVQQLLLLQSPLPGHFTKTHLFRIHKFLFGDIYPFAGRIRRESISKGRTMFYPPQGIDPALDKLFADFRDKNAASETEQEKQLEYLCHMMAELNIIHPFREGNGRAIREFIRCLGLHYGLHINWGNTDRHTLLDASILSVDDESALFPVITGCLEK